MPSTFHLAGVTATLFISAAVLAQATLPQYEIIDLGTLGGELANGLGICDAGFVVGQAEVPSLAAAPFIWTESEGIEYVGSLSSGVGGRADGVNNHRHVVGSSMAPAKNFPGTVAHAFLWTPEGGMVDIAPLPNPTDGSSWATDINDAGQICLNFMRGGHPDSGPWLREADGTMIPIRFPDGLVGWSMDAWQINENGVVVGGGWTPAFEFHAFRFDAASGIVELGTLGGRDSQAWGVNDSEHIVGWAQMSNNQTLPALWLPNEITPVALPLLETLPSENPVISGDAEAINNHNWIVGEDHSQAPGEYPIAWLLIPGDAPGTYVKDRLENLISDKDDEAWQLTAALAINDDGWITGIGIHTIDGEQAFGRAFLMRPIGVSDPCPADLDDSGVVNLFDLLDLLSAWGTGGPGAALAEPSDVVDLFDLLGLLSVWGPCKG